MLVKNRRYEILGFQVSHFAPDFCSNFLDQKYLQAEIRNFLQKLSLKISIFGDSKSKNDDTIKVNVGNVKRMTKVLNACNSCKDLNLVQVEHKIVKRVEKKANEN